MMMMSDRISSVVCTILLFVVIGCIDKKDNPDSLIKNGWTREGQVHKMVHNIYFNFPDTGYTYEAKDSLIEECFKGLESNLKIIGFNDFTDTIQVRFLNSPEDMFWLTRTNAGGITYPFINTLYLVANEEQKPPLKHELMHLIVMEKWGYPNESSTWINEGLAAYAENNCNSFNVAQIYRFFMDINMLIDIDSLSNDFYAESEMIAYHQSAAIVEHLLNNYETGKFKKLWVNGFGEFELIYGIRFSELKNNLEKSLLKKYPTKPNIDWESFKEGCI